MSEIVSKRPEDTEKICREIAQNLRAGDVVAFTGGLGSGKTFMIKAMCRELGVRDIVTSPTFTIMHIYEGREPILHLDCYRLLSPEEAVLLGLDEYFNSNYISLIEWADKIWSVLPEELIHIALSRVPEQQTWRTITINRS